MGIKREPWEFIENHGLKSCVIHGDPVFYSSTDGDPVPKTKKRRAAVDVKRSKVAVNEDPLCRFYRGSYPWKEEQTTPVEVWKRFSAKILARMRHIKFVHKYRICLDIRELMPKRKIESRATEQKPFEDMGDYKERALSTLKVTNDEFFEDGKAVPFTKTIWQRLLHAKHLRMLIYDYFKTQFISAMKNIDGVQLELWYDARGPWIITSESAQQDLTRPIVIAEGDPMCYACADPDDTNWFISEDSDHIVLSLMTAENRLNKNPCFLSGSGDRGLNATEAVVEVAKSQRDRIVNALMLNGTDFIYEHWPSRTLTRVIYEKLNGYTSKELLDEKTFMRFHRDVCGGISGCADTAYDRFRWNYTYWQTEGRVDLDRRKRRRVEDEKTPEEDAPHV